MESEGSLPCPRPCVTFLNLKNAVFWDVAPCRSCVNRRFGESIASIFRVEKFASEEPAEHVAADCFQLVAQSAASCSRWFLARGYFYPEDGGDTLTLVHTRSTRRHIPEDGILHSHRSENLKFYIS
jgi:hypothetical protein